MNENLTVIIVVYKTKKELLKNFINQIDANYKILIVDNGFSYNFGEIENLQNVSIYRSPVNQGNGDGINIGLRMVKSPYAIYFDIDTIFENTFLSSIENYITKIKSFCILLPNINSSNKSNEEFIEKYDGEGAIMLFNVREVTNVGSFDTDYFLYREETDLFYRCKLNDKKIYLLTKIIAQHDGSSSMEGDNVDLKIVGLRSWHLMWSYFYFYKKHYSYYYAITKCSNVFSRDLGKLIYFILKRDKLNICIRYNRLLGLISSILLLKSSKRP
jgi:GT2 family glycosyltransferase